MSETCLKNYLPDICQRILWFLSYVLCHFGKFVGLKNFQHNLLKIYLAIFSKSSKNMVSMDEIQNESKRKNKCFPWKDAALTACQFMMAW